MSFSLLIHGGAGAIHAPDTYRESLLRVVRAGGEALQKGASALDVVELCVSLLEDDELYNAGRGSVLRADGGVDCDASIMDGKGLRAGAVAAVSGIKNPVKAARVVMEKSPHVFLLGEGAEAFAREQGIAFEADSYFVVPSRVAQLEEARKKATITLDHDTEEKLGTVGAVARDSKGNLAAATSTGGMVNKQYGRIGDSPVIGAGVYADNDTCAVSCTGYGEQFLRMAVAKDAADLIAYKNLSATDAAREAIANLTKKIDGKGGLILIDKSGACGVAHSTPGILAARICEGEKASIV